MYFLESRWEYDGEDFDIDNEDQLDALMRRLTKDGLTMVKDGQYYVQMAEDDIISLLEESGEIRRHRLL